MKKIFKTLYSIFNLLYLLVVAICAVVAIDTVLSLTHPTLHTVWVWGSWIFIVSFIINKLFK